MSLDLGYSLGAYIHALLSRVTLASAGLSCYNGYLVTFTRSCTTTSYVVGIFQLRVASSETHRVLRTSVAVHLQVRVTDTVRHISPHNM